MNSAVVSYAQYGPVQGSQLAPPFPRGVAGDSRMSKRRRLDSPERYAPGAWDQQPPHNQASGQQQQPLYGPPALNNISSFGSSNAGSDFTTAGAPGGPHDGAAASGVSTLNDSSTTNAANTQWHGPGSSSYPDVSAYSQQPYFFGQTDPSTYNSPWPPADTSNTFGTQTNSYSIPAPSEVNQVMPYFPTARQSETSEPPFDANVSASLQNYSNQDVDAMQPYRYSQSGDGHHHRASNAVRASSSSVYLEDASMHLKIQSLSILENLATQLIHTISKSSFPQIQEIMQNAHNPNHVATNTNNSVESEEGQAYTTLKNLFDQTRKVYSRETPFIDAIAIQMFQPAQQEVIRKANIATFISSILGAHDVSFFHLNEFFMETFVPLGHRLLKWQGAIYLELKTQTYISALINSDSNPERMLDELFPGDLDAQILTRHPDAPSLSPSEQDFVDRCRARKNYLLAAQETDEGDAVRELPKKYQWSDFVREFASCITKNVDGIMNVPARSQPVFGDRDGARRGAAATHALHNTSNITGSRNAQAYQADQAGANSTTNASAHSKSSSHSTNATNTIRQPWTKPEEDALLSGLAQVNGPHWSQILALYGRGGSVSEVLKDRNQVQLKDKARNLKLWYLKMGKDVPVALRGVTGELRKRGGARARAALGLGLEESADGDDEGDGEGEDVIEVRKGSTPARRTKKRN